MDTVPDPPSPAEPGAETEPRTLTATEDMPPVREKPALAEENAQAAGAAPSAREKGAPLAAPPTEKTRHRPGRKWVRALLVTAVVVLSAAVVIALLAPGYLRGRVEEEARARGVVLAFATADYGFSKIVLGDVSLALSGVPDFQARATSIEVDLESLEPRAVRAGGLSVAMFGTEVLEQLGAWQKRHASALAAPISAEGTSIDWHPAQGAAAALSLRDAGLSADARTGKVEAASMHVAGRAIGPAAASWTISEGGVAVAIQPRAEPLSPLEVLVTSSGEGLSLKIGLARTPLAPLQEALGIPKGAEGIVAEAEVSALLPAGARPGPVDATLQMTVKGYVPPHPKELDGILFGDTTKVRSKLVIAADFSGAKMTQVDVEAGALALSGTGDVVREGFDARVTLKLTGSIACTQLATSAAVAHLGAAWGRLAGGLASGALSGNVGVALTVEARLSNIKGAKIDRSARLNCKVGLPGLPKIIID